MKLLNTLCFALCFLACSGCAHYFSNHFNDTKISTGKPTNQFCIRQKFIHPTEESKKVVLPDEDDNKYGKIIKLIKDRYPELVYNCFSSDKITLEYDFLQKKPPAIDLSVLSLGIIPLIFKNTIHLNVYDSSDTLLYKSEEVGTVVVSIFLVPFFFLHQWDYEIVFEQMDTFLSKEYNHDPK